MAIWNLYNEQITPRKRKQISEEDTEIQSHTSPMQRRHCPGQENAADHFSRGPLGNQIEPLDILWHGPSWLGKHEEYWPSGIFTTKKSHPEEKKKDPIQVLTATISASLIYASKFSSYWRLVRTTAWVSIPTKRGGREKSAGGNGGGTRCCMHALGTSGAKENLHVRTGSSSKELSIAK